MNYTALQVKTNYSILSSIISIKKLVNLAKNYGYTSLAITDESNMFGVMEFINACQKENIKPIIGIDLTINNSHILLYAKNNSGYKNIIKLSTIISSNELTTEDLAKYKDNLILVMPFSFYNEEIYNIYDDKFIGYSDIATRDKITKKRVLINDVSYLYKDDDIYLDYAKMIRDGKVLGEYVFGTNKNKHLLTKEEIMALSLEEDILNTKYIADNCNVSISYQDNLLPIYDKSINSKVFLHNLAYKGLNKRLSNNPSTKYLERLNYELKVIDKMGFNDYFLIVYDYVLYAKKNHILVGPGRGSAAGSLVSYSLGITEVDPIKYNLLFERFLNEERVTMPDIDIDFDATKRQDVIDYVISKYGEKKVVGIITFNTLGAKQVIRDVGKILNISPSLIDTLAKQVKDDLLSSYNKQNEIKKLVSSSDELKNLYKIALHLEGMPRHVSIHAAGIVMSSIDIDKTIPLYKSQSGMYLSGYSKDYLEPLGLLKMDFLGLSNLTFINNVINNIRDNLNLNITFNNIPLDDKLTNNLFSSGDTEGIFQFESPGMISFLKKLKPQSFSDIVLAISLYRPGPMDSINDFILRREGKKKVEYLNKDVENILKETYGLIVYQEQIMELARTIARYSLGEADILRRAISKKNSEIILKEKDKFISCSIAAGYDEEVVNKVYDLILKFANYGFNKSHAVSYAMISYKMAFLKAHFYSYFMLSLLEDNINSPTQTSTYIAKLRQKNITVLPPDINLSTLSYQIKDNKIICPLQIIKNISNIQANQIIECRQEGEFTSFINFAKRMYGKIIDKSALENLINAGVFNNLSINEQTLINNLDMIINYLELSLDIDSLEISEPILQDYPEYSKSELVKKELSSFGFYLSSHPVNFYRKNNKINTLSLNNYENKYISLVLEVNRIKEIMTKNNDVMAFLKASDEYTQIDLTLFPNIYTKDLSLDINDIIDITGKVEKRFNNYQIVVSKITNLTKESKKWRSIFYLSLHYY